jgi:hypothetical protein
MTNEETSQRTKLFSRNRSRSLGKALLRCGGVCATYLARSAYVWAASGVMCRHAQNGVPGCGYND